MKIPIYELEFSTRVANILNKEDITDVEQLVGRCISDGKFVGLKAKGRHRASNFEIAGRLYELGFLKSLDGIKRPPIRFRHLTLADLVKISKTASINLETKLMDLEWDWKFLHFLSCHSGERRGKDYIKYFDPPEHGAHLSVQDFIRQFVRIDNDGRYVFRTWNYWGKKSELEINLKLVRSKLIEWNIIDESS